MLCTWVSSVQFCTLLLLPLNPRRLRLEKFERVRYGLTKYRLIGNDSGERRCKGGWSRDGCMICLATHICSKRVTTVVCLAG